MKRITDANQHFSGIEPNFKGSTEELSKMSLILALNWYSKNKSAIDAEEYAQRYFKNKLNYTKPLKNVIPTFGFLCKINLNGGLLPEETLTWFNSQIDIIKNVTTKPSNSPKDKPTIQDRIKDKTNECIGELEHLFDVLFFYKKSTEITPLSILTKCEIKQPKDIIIHFSKRKEEYVEVLTTSDKDLKEGYSNFSVLQLNKIIKFFDQIITDCNNLTKLIPVVRKKRVVTLKTKPVEVLINKVNYCKAFPELSLVSIDPTNIIGATQLWVYNTRYKKLGVYYSDSGFSIAGTTLQSFNETKSIQKIVKKPEITLPEMLSASKVGLRKFMERITTTEYPLTGRIGPDTILLKVLK